VAKKYRVVLIGVSVDEEVFQKNMARLGVSSSVLKNYLEKAPVVLVRDLNLADARRYAEAIMDAGGHANIQETGETPQTMPSYGNPGVASQEDFMICSNCGFKQKRAPRCVRCGFEVTPSPR
jgi:predicted transcriptional regulator